MKYFSDEEQSCNCGCNLKIYNPTLNDMIVQARRIANIPFEVTSWTRCEYWNRKVGGSPTSSHIEGKAIDIKFKNNVDLFNIVSALMKVGFVRVGINYDSKFVHCDISMDKTQKVLFTY